MSPKQPLQAMNSHLDEALELLEGFSAGPSDAQDAPLPSLLDQCEEVCAALPGPEPLRSVHHFACTGGSLISKCIALMPNVTLLSEIDPLSRLMVDPENPMFTPSDMIYGARVALRTVSEDTLVRMFLAALDVLHRDVQKSGGFLVLRDHAHSQFCSDSAPAERPTLRDLMLQSGPVHSVVTVRHPLDSYLSLHKNNWAHQFTPTTLEGYAQRYQTFLARYEGAPRFRYEDFVEAPDLILEQICDALKIPYRENAESLLSIVRISGDSGRSSNQIKTRERAPIGENMRTEIAQSPTYSALCEALGYAEVDKA